jgi:hypothetical protein
VRSRPLVAALLVISCERRPDGGSDAPDRAGPAGAAVTDSARVAGAALELVATDSGCAVRLRGAAANELALAPKPPCYFLRRHDARPQTYAYPDVGVPWVLIVLGSTASDEARRKWKVPHAAVCGEETQAVLVKRERLVVSRSVRRGGVTCRDTGADEKEFWAFAHDPQ